MNILTDALPSSVEIGGKSYRINTDYRAALRSILAFEDEELTNTEKQMILLANLYPKLPKDINAAVERAVWFLDCGEEQKETGSKPRVYSFSKDSKAIFAAFRQTHGIDLTIDHLHWWQFVALFMDLGSDTLFCNLASLRSRVKSNKATKEERQAAREMGDMFDIPEVESRSIEEIEAERAFMEAVEAAQRKRDGR